MERVNPADFKGPRAYFTDFDYKIVRFKYNKKQCRKEVERRLKIILLTKNTVVCAASHLTHQFAYTLFKDNPILLEENMVIPALRRDKDHVTDYLSRASRKSIKEEMGNFYIDHVNSVVDWELIPNTTWFRQHLLEAIKDDRSVISRNLNMPSEKVRTLVDDIENNAILYREKILDHISDWPMREQKHFLNFVNLVYHMSGARVVNCESTLPQETYIDYSLADFSKRRTMLSDTQIFLKIFFELAFEILYKYTLPVELLDVLTFEDIYYLRKPIKRSSFCEKYDELLRKCIQAIRKPMPIYDKLAYDIEEPWQILEQISETFEEIFKQELAEFLEKKYRAITKELQKSTLSLGLGIIGLVPVVGNVADAISLLSSSRDVFVNLTKSLKSKREAADYDLYIKAKEAALRKFIANQSISEKSVLLDTLDLIVDTISAKTRL